MINLPVSICFRQTRLFLAVHPAGIFPTQAFQDMYIEVAAEGFHPEISNEFEIMNARLDDVAEMVSLEKRLCGIERTEDFEYFIENKRGIWNTVVCRYTRGSLLGFLGSVDHPASRMIGPGVAESEQVTMELLATLLNRFHGKCPVFLLPRNRQKAVNRLRAPGVPEQKSIFPSVAGKINRLRGLSCQPSCLKLGNLILFIPGRSTKPIVHFLVKRSHGLIEVQETPRDPASPQSRCPERFA